MESGRSEDFKEVAEEEFMGVFQRRMLGLSGPVQGDVMRSSFADGPVTDRETAVPGGNGLDGFAVSTEGRALRPVTVPRCSSSLSTRPITGTE
ncbi:hypothetical protein GCM10027294_21390 [Marinactinospora endophytica]